VVAQEHARHGACTLFIEKIAALAGVTRSTVKRALKEAHGLGMIKIEERRLTGWRNDANLITILDLGWLMWLRMRNRGEGSRKGPARNTRLETRGFRNEEAAQAPGETSKAEPPQATRPPYSAPARGFPSEPGMDRTPTKAMSGLYRRRM
jgi:hypothetical protein